MRQNDPARQPVRWDLIRRVRREIARGIYVTPEKLEATADALCAALTNRPRPRIVGRCKEAERGQRGGRRARP